jgi:hypothetical protein
MTQTHPYCRTCGSHIQSKDVCPHCGCEPLKGHNYCCDCGTPTVPEAVMCVHCGASFQRKFPATLAVLVSIALAATIAAAGYFITHGGSETPENVQDSKIENKKNVPDFNKTTPRQKDEPVKIINNIPSNLLSKSNDAITRVIKKLPVNPRPETQTEAAPEAEPVKKPVAVSKKEEVVTAPEETRTVTSGKISMNIFSSREMRNYSVGCTYFEGKSKNNVVFFTTNVYGYVKVNGKVYALQGVQKGNDIARFSGAGYDVSIEIEGLAGNENDWVAEATLIVRDVRQRTLSRRKVYSSCTEF